MISLVPLAASRPPPPLGDLAIDISSNQSPKELVWDKLDFRYSAVYVRYSAGLTPDKHAVAHAKAAREHARDVGGYLYFRDDSAPEAQFDVFQAQFEKCGQSEDLAVALDFEWQPKNRLPDPLKFLDQTQELIELVEATFGPPLIYTNAAFFAAMKRPKLWTRYDQWIANYNDLLSPPKNLDPARGTGPVMWQNKVQPISGFCTRLIDQNRILRPLPRCQ